MAVGFSKASGERIIELGGGSNRDPVADCNVDIRQVEGVDFVVDFNKPDWPIQSDEWSGVLAKYVLEHIGFAQIPIFLKECFRILKVGGKLCVVTANTEAQLRWIQNNPNGWDGKDAFTSMSEVLFGSQNMDLDANTHRSFFSPVIIAELFQKAGFEQIKVMPAGERQTDLLVEAIKPLPNKMEDIVQKVNDELKSSMEMGIKNMEVEPVHVQSVSDGKNPILDIPREELFDKAYFNGGHKFGGYASDQGGAYRDFPVHNITFQHVLDRKPESVLEVGAGRGYILKRLQDVGIRTKGLEISKHCYMTRACNDVILTDLCRTPWSIKDREFNLCFSIAVMEHIPEEFIPSVIQEMARTCVRGLLGIDFGEKDDGFDKTHISLKSKNAWIKLFRQHAPGWPVEIVDKESLEQGPVPATVIQGDDRIKLNIGCFTVQNHCGWINLDIHDLRQYSQQYGYRFQQCDVRQGLPFKTSEVDLIQTSHMLEHLDRNQGISFLRECRRVLASHGVMRIAVPDAHLLIRAYAHDVPFCRCVKDNGISLSEFNEINDGCEDAPTSAGKLWELLFSGHQALYDEQTLCYVLKEAGFTPFPVKFRETKCGDLGKQLLRESLDIQPELSLYCEAIPHVV